MLFHTIGPSLLVSSETDILCTAQYHANQKTSPESPADSPVSSLTQRLVERARWNTIGTGLRGMFDGWHFEEHVDDTSTGSVLKTPSPWLHSHSRMRPKDRVAHMYQKFRNLRLRDRPWARDKTCAKSPETASLVAPAIGIGPVWSSSGSRADDLGFAANADSNTETCQTRDKR
ncbi:unnamed protein product [Kuraishia capsulata CBS 1993]|uniref:Uncharacterized protein n=1 Tax=Kuraishia capsulata CBS 1993 TaxID=1382522 RepID=W6MQ85_9ASCO|nr:uncharacterized protein KUCA_T00004884001 [Kuraishia capsulata CBS 1993]CDK28899.1 unnamed protein product [Kuraishia capsulata CBS 1993]